VIVIRAGKKFSVWEGPNHWQEPSFLFLLFKIKGCFYIEAFDKGPFGQENFDQCFAIEKPNEVY
jgi:hypothetical protein